MSFKKDLITLSMDCFSSLSNKGKYFFISLSYDIVAIVLDFCITKLVKIGIAAMICYRGCILVCRIPVMTISLSLIV